MAQAVTNDLNNKEAELNKLINDSAVIKRFFSEKPTENDIKLLADLPFYIYGYQNGGLMFWNTNELLADCNYNQDQTQLIKNDRGSFIKKCLLLTYLDNRKKLTVLFPIVHKYSFENNYLKPHFEAEDYIPVNTQVLDRKVAESYEIKDPRGKPLFYLLFPDEAPTWIPGKLLLVLIITALLTSIIWVQLITIYLTRKKTPLLGFSLTVAAIIIIRLLLYAFGLPFNLDNLPIFSPQLYASSAFLPSLGDLLLNALCFLWIGVFALRHAPYNIFQNVQFSKVGRVILAIAFSLFLLWFGSGYISIIKSLVVDSRISFDVGRFYSITSYTIVGLFTIGIITGASCLIIYLINVQLQTLTNNRWYKYLLLIGIGTVCILLKGGIDKQFSLFMLLSLLLFIMLMDIRVLTNTTDLFAPQIVLLAVLVCGICTGILLYFFNIKEKETRKRYADRVLQQRDDVTEFAFRNISQSIQNDKTVKLFLEDPTAEKRRSINDRFDALYLGGPLNNYQAKILIFDSNGRSLFNNDTTSYHTLAKEIRNSMPTSDSTLFYKEYAQDGHYYLANIPIAQDTAGKRIGSVFIDLAIKESGGETVYPELLQPGSIKNSQVESDYSYAVYVNNRLLTQNGEHFFPVNSNPPIKPFSSAFIKWGESSEYWYRPDNVKTVIVIRFHKLWLDSITLFSYLFGIQMLIVLFIVLYRLILSYFTRPKNSTKLINLTLRKRIHFSMLGIVLISFCLIGVATIGYFTVQYKQTTRKKLQRTMQAVERSILQFLKQENAINNNQAFNEKTTDVKFRYFITGLANVQKIDINIFNASGILNVASQENIYDKILLARIIRPDAYFQLNTLDAQSVTQTESIGRLSYLSSYVPIRDQNGKALGYINVPFFSSEKELKVQISNILVVLINIYAFIFLVSGVMTVFITRWLTQTLSVVISRFERLSLTKNEPIYWPYEDEIGTLVAEYNKMVKKVEENAILLAQSERESAWREMARQVAHEIKNPLTPMKLNIQYMQQAIKNGHPNIGELSMRVSEALIEQIDNLSYIASEFSNFAKMPEAKPEEVELNELLDKAVELYLNEENIKVVLKKGKDKLAVYADKSQLLRVFTNLLENAVQAVPEGKNGIINVMLKKEQDHALISFEDNGSGIPFDTRERIFQPYFTTKSSGTGLGLAMTKKIIEFWKGAIWFETEEGEGTTFYIRLPLVKSE